MMSRVAIFFIGLALAVASALCVTLGSLQFTLLVLLPFWIPFFLLLRALFFGGGDEGRLGRQKFGVLLGSSVFSTFVLVLALILFQPQRAVLHPPRGFAAYKEPMTPAERAGAEHLHDLLGWAPFDAKGRFGMWQTEVDPEKEKILIFGDSVMYAWGVLEGETTPAQLDELLPEHQVINMAVSGWSIDQYYLYLRETIGKIRPKVVIVGIFVGNDFQVTARGFGWGHSKPFFKLDRGQLVHTNPGLLSNNCIDVMAQSLLFKPFWRNKIFAQMVLKTLCGADDLPLAEAEGTVASLVDGIAAIADEHKTQLLFLLLPDINDFPHVGNYHYHKLISFRSYFFKLMREKGYDYMDAANALGAPTSELQRQKFIDPAHPTAEGHKLIAAAVHDYLKANYLGNP